MLLCRKTPAVPSDPKEETAAEQKSTAALPDMLVNFLFNISEQVRIKELRQVHFQSVADFLDRGYGCRIIPAIDNVIQGGLGNAAHPG